jgi:pimeloyl-ACP methyl ester carboxylesterase
VINHHREGAGAPLVLLHGIGLRWQINAPVIGRLATGFEVIACDSPGFGASPPLPDGVKPTIPAYADAFERFFAAQGLERPHVAGNSMGGAIALELARRGAVRSATAISPAGFWTPAERRFCQLSLAPLTQTPSFARTPIAALARTRAGRLALLWQTFGHPTRVPAGVVVETLRAAWAAPAFAGALAAFDDYSFGDGEQLVDTPVTIAWGIHDRLLPFRTQAGRARTLLPSATHLTLGVGHVPFYDDPPVVVATIRSGASGAARATPEASAAPAGLRAG